MTPRRHPGKLKPQRLARRTVARSIMVALNAESPLVSGAADSQNAGGHSNLFQPNSKKSSLTVEYARDHCARGYGPQPLARRMFPPQRNLHQGVTEPDQGD